MKKYIKIIIVIFIILLAFISIFYFARKMSLNNYLNKTIEYSDKINYSTNIQLNIESESNSSKIEYDIIRSSYIKKITISNYIDDKIINKINKYIVSNGTKKGIYKYNGSKYVKVTNEKEDFIIDYSNLKDKIINIKKIQNLVIDNVSYKKYIVSMKAYEAYNLLYDNEVLTKKDTNDVIDVNILIDKSKNFVYEISYEINSINDSTTNNTLKYTVEIINRDINNTDDIKLPF